MHVPAGDGGEVDGLGEPAERDLEVLLEELLGVALAGPADHLAALGRPRHGERVEDRSVALPSRSACAASYGAVAAHAMPPPAVRLPHVVVGAEVLVERGDVELVGAAGRA